ncbi:MAG: hypothetical protein HYR51_06690 [Candidatus Rokubacteria bacterium]|nr:hypothetical protein [Candidatus Rokubacteria bacterium]
MALGMLALFAGLAGGLVRLGWTVPAVPSFTAFHGPLMVSGFLGTVIGLERAVALGRRWAYVAPLATGVGALALAAGWPGGVWLLTLGSAVMTLVAAVIVTRQTALFTVVMAAGALCWLVGQTLWLAGWPIHRVVFWWIGFLVLTIAGERLELTRLLPLGATPRASFVGAAVALVAGLAWISVAPDAGVRVVGVSLIALAVWLGVFDITRRTIRQSGLTRFIAVALLSGYAWLGVGGVVALGAGATPAGLQYDALLHAILLGFVFSMIFGHAPIIFPAVLGVPIAYRPAFYAHLALLHASLVLRIAGDLAPWPFGRAWGGLLNGVAIVAFLANTLYGALASRE